MKPHKYNPKKNPWQRRIRGSSSVPIAKLATIDDKIKVFGKKMGPKENAFVQLMRVKFGGNIFQDLAKIDIPTAIREIHAGHDKYAPKIKEAVLFIEDLARKDREAAAGKGQEFTKLSTAVDNLGT